MRIVDEALGADAASVVEQGAVFLRERVNTRRVSTLALAQGDFLPNLLIDNAVIVGVIDWEFAGPAPAAFDLARWEASAGAPWHDRVDLLRRGYARVADPESAAAGLVPAFAVDWALEKLGWKNPASPAQFRRCVDVIARRVLALSGTSWRTGRLDQARRKDLGQRAAFCRHRRCSRTLEA